MANNIDLGIPVAGFIFFISNLGSPFVGQCWMKCPGEENVIEQTNLALAHAEK